jgi:ABC-type lipoprotein export system ATPase subunit
LAVETTNVGGLVDGKVDLPEGPMTALAGGNGTGKSKLLACILTPWSHAPPAAVEGQESQIRIHMKLTEVERAALNEFSDAAGWGQVDVPELFSVLFRQHPTAGLHIVSDPEMSVLAHAWPNAEFMQAWPSLNVVYLPAERRLIAPNRQHGIDLNQLSDLIAAQKVAEPRSAVQNYGRLDDQEFESFAKALCVAAALPSEHGSMASQEQAETRWSKFQATVNSLIAPKTLLPLTREHPDQLRVETFGGARHAVQELSSGERQALIIMSRVLRAGGNHPLVLIDEPDAYLHPHLSQRLIQALQSGVGRDGQLIVATHSPSVLDSIPPTSILRLSHGELPHPVSDETERLDLYRSAGFRASALTQSDLLLIVEGESDIPLLSLLFPDLARASMREAGGRARVVREVEQLSPHQIPVRGVVDRDILASALPTDVADLITVWKQADLEGVFLSDPAALQVMIDRGLMKPEFMIVELLQDKLKTLVDAQRENVIAELAQKKLRVARNWHWPSPKGEAPIDRLRAAIPEMSVPGSDQCEAAITEAEAIWDEQTDETRWQLVRGKYIVNQFASEASEMKSGRALLEAVARERPLLTGLNEFASAIGEVLALATLEITGSDDV